MCILGSLLLDTSHAPQPPRLFPSSAIQDPSQGLPHPPVCPSSQAVCSPYLATCSLGGRGGTDITQEGGMAWMRGSSQSLGEAGKFLQVTRAPHAPSPAVPLEAKALGQRFLSLWVL